MLSQHNISSARYAESEPQGGYADDAPVVAVRYGKEEIRYANDDIESGGMLAFLADGGTIDPYQPPPIAPDDVQAERERRLQLGFDYDFGDGRGVHRIGTTAADMVGWNDVDKAANALSALGDNITTITIVTDTGPVDITSSEWMQITLAATAFRQPIWAGSFWLQAQNPIPSDYAANDAYWSA
jgi:hypothetical protein